MRRIIVLIVALVALFILFSGIPSAAGFVVDWLWFRELGLESVFLTALGTKLTLGAVVTVIVFAFLYGNVRLAQRGVVPDPLVALGVKGVPKIDFARFARGAMALLTTLLAMLIGAGASGGWLTLQQFLHRTPFGVTDPVFGRDVGYYVFTLPLVSALLGMVFGVTLLTLLMVVPLYVLRRDVILRRRRVTVEHGAEWHLAALIALLFVVLAANAFFVRLPSLLYATTGPLYGASFTDLSVRHPFLVITTVVSLAATAFVLLGARRHRLALHTGIAAIAYLAVGMAAGLSGAAMQRLVVIPNELTKEVEQLRYHIAATRQAWGLDRVTVRDLRGESSLTLDDMEANSGTINNVRLWDRDPLLQTFGQLQEIRTYYDFVSVDDDRYWVDGEYRQVLLSLRELNTRSLPTRTFVNERLAFTHGMGLTLSPVNQLTQEGLPVLFIKDLPPVSTVSLDVTRPGIYYGELSSDWVFVRTNQPEFDYPAEGGNVSTVYDGLGGVPVSSWFRRLLLSVHFGSMKILLSEYITNESRVLFHRNIRERAARALPFLRWDGDPYIVIRDDGRLAWVLDAYTGTSRYPYSQPVESGLNYLRNSVKVVIDAYDGDVRAYLADAEDPIARTFNGIFDGILQPLDSMPDDLRAHIRYPEDLFRLQTQLYQTFHMSEPDIFYHREDEWQKPALARGEMSRDPFLRHIILRLPEEEREEYILMSPFTPRGKDNLSAWMVARNDGERYGELVVYRFPRQSLVFGPTQVVNRINQDTEVSRQISLWDQRGSEVIRGNLLVIPIEESLLFVQALYLRAEGGRIPELKRIIVAYENQVVMEESLEEGLTRLFSGQVRSGDRPAADDSPTPALSSIAELIRQASEHYQRALTAQRAGDWARYGEEMRLMGEALRALEERAGGGS